MTEAQAVVAPPQAVEVIVGGPGQVVEVIAGGNTVEIAAGQPAAQVVEVVTGGASIPGPPGPAASSQRFDVTSPAGTWNISHGLSRVPMVQVYLSNGEQVVADIDASASTIVVTFAQPTAGFVLFF